MESWLKARVKTPTTCLTEQITKVIQTTEMQKENWSLVIWGNVKNILNTSKIILHITYNMAGIEFLGHSFFSFGIT